MTRLWKFLSSTTLTIVIAALVCVVAAWGSLKTVAHPEFYRALDTTVLLPWLFGMGGMGGVGGEGLAHLDKTGWIIALVILIALFALNTTICTIDKVYATLKGKKPVQSLFPHIVHVGFLIALLGHLLGSSYGFKNPGLPVIEGDTVQVPEVPGLVVRLDDTEMVIGPTGAPDKLSSALTLIKDGVEVAAGTAEINSPLMYEGMTFYHVNQGRTTTGLVMKVDGGVDGTEVEASFGGSFSAGATVYTLGELYPDFAASPDGTPYSRSAEFANPVQEIIAPSSEGGLERGYLPLGRRGATATVGGVTVTLHDYVMGEYAVIAVYKDPGVWFIIWGSGILVIGMVLLLLMRGERGELVRGGGAGGMG